MHVLFNDPSYPPRILNMCTFKSGPLTITKHNQNFSCLLQAKRSNTSSCISVNIDRGPLYLKKTLTTVNPPVLSKQWEGNQLAGEPLSPELKPLQITPQTALLRGLLLTDLVIEVNCNPPSHLPPYLAKERDFRNSLERGEHIYKGWWPVSCHQMTIVLHRLLLRLLLV